jgi:hypothetical protein|tara:strand:+ start:9078 stop:9326 length:249 start_codon:yes stop_codon:yes gene_type:complete
MPKESPLIKELEAWQSLTKLPEWDYYVQLMNKHCMFLQKEVNRCVKSRDFEGAIAFLAKKEEIPRVLGLVNSRIRELEKGEG